MIAVASDGDANNVQSNREVDLNMFPSELFTQIDVAKTPRASQLEGGIAGSVDLKSIRPFDNRGQHVSYSVSRNYKQIGGDVSPKGAVIFSKTWDKWGVVVGATGSGTKYRHPLYK